MPLRSLFEEPLKLARAGPISPWAGTSREIRVFDTHFDVSHIIQFDRRILVANPFLI